MDQMITIAFSFPTITFSVLLILVVIYWLIGLIGLIDLDIEGDVDVEANSDVSAGGVSGLLLTFGLTGVPVTIVVSIIVLVCWIVTYYVHFYLLNLLSQGWLLILAGLISNIAIFFLSLPVTAVLIRPLKKLFKNIEAVTSSKLVGLEAVVATGTMTPAFGQAKLINDGAELLVEARCVNADELKLGDKVLIIEYIPESHSYIVSPYQH